MNESNTPWAGEAGYRVVTAQLGYTGGAHQYVIKDGTRTSFPLSSSNQNEFIKSIDWRLNLSGDPRVRAVSTMNVASTANPNVNKRLLYNVGYMDKGEPAEMICPPGTGLSGIKVWGDSKTGRLQGICTNLMTGAKSRTSEIGTDKWSNMGTAKELNCPANSLATRMDVEINSGDGASSDRFGGIRLVCRDYNAEFNVLRTENGKLNCCWNNSNPNDPACSGYYRGGDKCDTFMYDFCRRNPTHQRCLCINSPLVKSGGRYNPTCHDAECLTYGYKPANMRVASCPSITECNMVFDMQNYGLVNFQDANFVQRCGQDANANPQINNSGTGQVNTSGATYSGGGASTGGSSNTATGGSTGGSLLRDRDGPLGLSKIAIFGIVGIFMFFMIIIILVAASGEGAATGPMMGRPMMGGPYRRF